MTSHTDIGVMGGMFDPVHFGHLRTALEVLQTLALAEMRLIPCGIPAHRDPPEASSEQRMTMLELAAQGTPAFVVDGRECRRPGPSYMVDTLRTIRRERPESRLFFLVGTDAFNGLDTWYHWRELFELAHLVLLPRPPWTVDAGSEAGREYQARRVDDTAQLVERTAGGIIQVDLPPLEISSSHIRNEIYSGKSARYLLPDTVLDYIDRHRLYT